MLSTNFVIPVLENLELVFETSLALHERLSRKNLQVPTGTPLVPFVSATARTVYNQAVI